VPRRQPPARPAAAAVVDISGLTPKGQRTQRRLVEAGRTVLERRGYAEATIVEITEEAELALGSFYRYFDNKERLFLDLLEVLVEELYDSVGGSWGGEDVRENLRESSRRYLRAYYSNRKLIGALLAMAGAVPECASLWWDLRTRTYDRMEAYLRASPVADEIDTKLIATALGSMVEQFAFHWFVEAERNGKRIPSVERAAETVSFIWYRTIYEEQIHP
jgi:AcrR family transcriptional regulator